MNSRRFTYAIVLLGLLSAAAIVYAFFRPTSYLGVANSVMTALQSKDGGGLLSFATSTEKKQFSDRQIQQFLVDAESEFTKGVKSWQLSFENRWATSASILFKVQTGDGLQFYMSVELMKDDSGVTVPISQFLVQYLNRHLAAKKGVKPTSTVVEVMSQAQDLFKRNGIERIYDFREDVWYTLEGYVAKKEIEWAVHASPKK